MKNKSILVTGGAGFIGSAFIRLLLRRDCPRRGLSQAVKGLSPKGTVPDFDLQSKELSLTVVDKLTYAGDLKRLQGLPPSADVPDFKFYKVDICDKKRMESIFKKEKPEIIVHFAAETHVDRSILNATAFLRTNVIGTQVLLDLSRKYQIKRFIHISTDEVYGDIEKGKFTEDSPLKPNSPYAASKAAVDLLIRSYIRTYCFPAIIIRPCNNYGPWQYPEKLIPVVIYKALKGEKVPVYAKGLNVREWLYVSDCAEAILSILAKGKIGEIYNVGSKQVKRNIEVVKKILNILGRPSSLIHFVKDRPGHDIRYRLNSKKVFTETGWEPKTNFADGIRLTIDWYLRHKDWLLNKARISLK